MIFSCLFFLILFAQNIDSGHTLEPPQWAVLISTHNQCFRVNIRQKCLFL